MKRWPSHETRLVRMLLRVSVPLSVIRNQHVQSASIRQIGESLDTYALRRVSTRLLTSWVSSRPSAGIVASRRAAYTQEASSFSLSARCFSPRTYSQCASTMVSQLPHLAYVAFGSNLGDRLSNIGTALQNVNEQDGVRVENTSSIWETDPMYVIDQGPFLNGVCKVRS